MTTLRLKGDTKSCFLLSFRFCAAMETMCSSGEITRDRQPSSGRSVSGMDSDGQADMDRFTPPLTRGLLPTRGAVVVSSCCSDSVDTSSRVESCQTSTRRIPVPWRGREEQRGAERSREEQRRGDRDRDTHGGRDGHWAVSSSLVLRSQQVSSDEMIGWCPLLVARALNTLIYIQLINGHFHYKHTYNTHTYNTHTYIHAVHFHWKQIFRYTCVYYIILYTYINYIICMCIIHTYIHAGHFHLKLIYLSTYISYMCMCIIYVHTYNTYMQVTFIVNIYISICIIYTYKS